MAARTMIVTGANTGIGEAVAHQLAALGHHVVLVSRDPEKGTLAADRIREATGSETVDVVHGDLSTAAHTHDLADRLLAQYPAIHVLINNAGVWPVQRSLNPDGIEMAFMVNHLAPFVLSTRLQDRLRASAPARIVNVNAGLFVNGEADLDLLPTGKNFGRFKTYMHTKLCNVLFTVEFARRLEGNDVTMNALHPGVIRTNLGVAPGILGRIIKFVKRFWATPEQGAKPVVRLATDPALEGVTGMYYNEFDVYALPPKALDEAKAMALWALSENLTTPDESAGR